MLVSGETDLDIMTGSLVHEEKWMRKAAKQALTRKKTALENTINGELADVDVEMAKNELIEAFNKLETTHDSYVAAKDSDTDEPEDL